MKLLKILPLLILILPSFAFATTKSLDLERSSSQYASITNAAQTGLDLTLDFTIELWAKLESAPSGDSRSFISKYNSGSNQRSYQFYYRDDGGTKQLFTAVSPDGTSANSSTKNQTLTAGTWYFVTVTYTASSGIFEYFINGTSIGTNGSTAANIFDSTAPFIVGSRDSAIDELFDGLLDEIRIFNLVREDADIATDATTELCGDESGLVAYWKFEDDYTDSSANSNTLTPSGSPVFSVDVPTIDEATCDEGGSSSTTTSATSSELANQFYFSSIIMFGIILAILGFFTSMAILKFYHIL